MFSTKYGGPFLEIRTICDDRSGPVSAELCRRLPPMQCPRSSGPSHLPFGLGPSPINTSLHPRKTFLLATCYLETNSIPIFYLQWLLSDCAICLRPQTATVRINLGQFRRRSFQNDTNLFPLLAQEKKDGPFGNKGFEVGTIWQSRSVQLSDPLSPRSKTGLGKLCATAKCIPTCTLA